jgi:hypothetical protein
MSGDAMLRKGISRKKAQKAQGQDFFLASCAFFAANAFQFI